MSLPIQIRNLYHRYPNGVIALRDVSLSIAPGERVAVLGHNGAGKTTLARHLNGLLRPTHGVVLLGEWDTRQQPVERLARRVGYVFQNPDEQLFARTLRDEVAFGPRNLGYPPARTAELVAEALSQCGLSGLAEAHPYDLAWPQRRWVAIASVLAMNTPVVVLDEPTAGQDEAGLARLASLIQSLAARGRTVIVISHDLEFCSACCERWIVLQAGAVRYDGAWRAALSEPARLTEAGLHLPPLLRLVRALKWEMMVGDEAEFLDALRQRRTHSGKLSASAP